MPSLTKRRDLTGRPKRLLIFKKSRAVQAWLMRNPWIKPMCVFNFAAVKIQRLMRGYLVRSGMSGRSRAPSSTKRSKKKLSSNRQLDKYLKYLDEIKKGQRGKPHWLNGGFSSWCTVRIQALWRMLLCKAKHLARRRLVNQVAAIVLQSFWRDIMSRKPVSARPSQAPRGRTHDQATRIQRAWRSFCCRRIYRYFRDLIMLKLRAAPVDLLRTIIPREAFALDRAAGIHVRFRLGGWIFPPKLYFKIFTHRPLCDVNAFAPRCYVKEQAVDATVRNNKANYVNQVALARRGRPAGGALKVGVRYFETVVSSNCSDGTASWYRREDHNSWRAIASQLLSQVSPPPWFEDVQAAQLTSKAAPFHFSTVHRKQDMLLRRKRRKREWMRKLYGLQQNQNTSEEVEEVEEDGGDLLLWSAALDFEKYANSWTGLGTSLPSDFPLSGHADTRRPARK